MELPQYSPLNRQDLSALLFCFPVVPNSAFPGEGIWLCLLAGTSPWVKCSPWPVSGMQAMQGLTRLACVTGLVNRGWFCSLLSTKKPNLRLERKETLFSWTICKVGNTATSGTWKYIPQSKGEASFYRESFCSSSWLVPFYANEESKSAQPWLVIIMHPIKLLWGSSNWSV